LITQQSPSDHLDFNVGIYCEHVSEMAINNLANLVSLVYLRSPTLVPPFFRVVPSRRHAPAKQRALFTYQQL
ncbi:hypothetical protein, partial [Vibrio sp. 10N.261.52.F3]|uniref:hypothetical protein n=1 Tax=Vibrio sp. 10N.261.52.F3 TaxID=3229683 RepID=UPI00354C51A6